MSDLKVGSLSAVQSPAAVGAPAIGASDPRAAALATRSGKSEATDAPSGPAVALAQAASLDAGPQPIDSDRVEAIRSAIAKGRYPLVPARIADAVIAAGILLHTTKA